MNGIGHHERRARGGAARYALELPITFEQGVGVTLAVSREEVQFTTLAAVAVGQHLTGRLRFPAEAGATGTALRYVARVTGVDKQPCGSEGRFAVRARFEQLDFIPWGSS
jgi:hypothetical protein